MEFKGTKGKWELGGATIEGVLISARHPQNRDICTVWAYDVEFLEQQEAKANALLISKAPEMLEMLNDLHGRIDFSGEAWGSNEGIELSNKIKQLIKEATEL